MGRRTEGGLAIYLAAEGPRSVRARAFVYQREHQVKLPLFAIVSSSIDLFDGDADVVAAGREGDVGDGRDDGVAGRGAEGERGRRRQGIGRALQLESSPLISS